jgi:hypothetical protein
MRLLLGLLLLTACASNVQKKIDQRKAEVTVDAPEKQAFIINTDEIKNDANLTEAQKEKLLKLHQETYDEIQKINLELKKYKKLLFDFLFAENYQAVKVSATEKRIKDTYKKKVDLLLSASRKTKEILGKYKKPHSEMIWFNL